MVTIEIEEININRIGSDGAGSSLESDGGRSGGGTAN